jgi:cell division protein FtsI (penicillin-binding protein 3)
MVSREKRNYSFLLILLTTIVGLIIFLYLSFVIIFKNSNKSDYKNPIVAQRVIRGTIYDSNRQIMAIEIPTYSVALLLNQTKNIEHTATLIAPILNIERESIISQAALRSTYYLVKNKLSNKEKNDLEKLVKDEKLSGILIEKNYSRFYPQHYHGSQIIGFTNSENRGLEGIERKYESILNPYPNLNEKLTYGNNIILTIDLDLQYLLDAAAVEIDQQHKSEAVVGLIMGAQDGQILASTSFPWYDLNLYQNSNSLERQNQAISSTFEPGSVFKIFSLAAELESNQADFETPFYCDGTYQYTTKNGSEVIINCVSNHGYVDPKKMLALSCNGAVAHWALQTEDQAFHTILNEFGFGQRWDAQIDGSTRGLFSNYLNWSQRSKSTISFGQEIGVSALHLVTAATAFATKGDVMQPYVIKAIEDYEGNLIEQTESKIAQKNVISKEVANTVIEGMVLATEIGGTAIHSRVDGVKVAAKTGTAQVANPSGSGYQQNSYLASTLAIVPADKPKYIIYMGALNPSGSTIWGSNITAPAIGSIIEDMVRQGKIFSTKSPKIQL